ncbi:MAG: hypothetical protein KC421_07160, partial [Anaerolineales bacterium]|nr:hypothetical protein [Anaerolineales bacterium]
MSTHRSWIQIAPTYRSREVKIVVDWIIGGVSGTVVGLPGVGKSNFLGFLCYRPDVIRPMLAAHDVEATLIPIDLNNLPDDSNATFYRVILRSFYENCEHIDPSLKQVINSIYRENKAARDPF